MMKAALPRRRPLIQKNLMALFVQKRIHKGIKKEECDVWRKRLHRIQNQVTFHDLIHFHAPSRTTLESISCTHRASLISTQNVRLLDQDLSCIHFNQHVRACFKKFSIYFAAHEMAMSRKLQTQLRSRKCTTDQNGNQLTRLGSL